MKLQNPKIFENEFNKIGKFLDYTSKAPNDYKHRWLFKNGYGISVIRTGYSYGEDEGKFEIAVLKDNKLCFTSKITDDVIGHLTSKQVLEIGLRISKLKEK